MELLVVEEVAVVVAVAARHLLPRPEVRRHIHRLHFGQDRLAQRVLTAHSAGEPHRERLRGVAERAGVAPVHGGVHAEGHPVVRHARPRGEIAVLG